MLNTNLRVNADSFIAFIACVCKHGFITFDTIGMIISEHVALSSQRFIALPTTEMAGMPILGHGLRVFATENQL